MNRAISSLLTASLGAMLAAAQQPPAATPQLAAGTVTVEENVPYGSVNGSELRLDVYQPAGSRTELHPAVLLIHGG